MQIQRGQRGKLEQYFDMNASLKITTSIQGSAVYDYVCFGVDANDKLSDDRYMLFFNQEKSPNGEITFFGRDNSAEFNINLRQLPANIRKLVFTASIDGDGVMGNINRFSLTMTQDGKETAEFILNGADFKNEKAIIALEIYRKGDDWRFNAVGRGFDGGLDVLLESFGGEQIKEEIPEAPPKVSLEKKLAEGAPKLVSLAKPLKVSLEKHKLTDIIARVALVLDISGSMSGRYRDGTVQEIVNRTLPLAVQFDDDGELDFWYYGSKHKRMPSLNMGNYLSAVPTNWQNFMTKLGCGNNEPPVIRDVMDEYEDSDIPAYIMFITDGGVSQSNKIKALITEASSMPIFWQ
ncbi:MAG: VWA domain-containing protein, partial [Selenomonadaceae bacterium]|nr:VWA domain-containing protein [Selenomonadaceae bacterium]